MPIQQKKTLEQTAAEGDVESFRRDLGPFVVAAEKTRMAMVFTDAKEPGDPIIFANDSFLSLVGYARHEVLGRNFDFLMVENADTGAREKLKTALQGDAHGDLNARCRRKEGDVFWAAIILDPVRDETGEIVQHFASFVDLTRHKEEEEHLRLLLDELNHRTQNTLATVQSIAVQTLRGVAGEAVVQAFEERILALAKVHALLGREEWRAVSLRDLIDQILQPFGPQGRRSGRFSIVGDDVRVQPKAALTLAMALHELAMNAARYGALSNGVTGTVGIDWQVEPHPWGDRLRLQWRERGGPLVTRPSRKGFGSRLIEGGLARDLGGEARLSFEAAGVVCQIVMPIRRGSGNDHG